MFDDIYENEYVKRLLTSMIKKNRLVHAIILTGQQGLGKLTFAKLIANVIVNNQNKLVENHVDIKLIDGNISGGIFVDDIRDLKKKMNVIPNESDSMVEIIANCDKMTIQAQNAILKMLEEPNKNRFFILTASNLDKLLGTILSRVMIIEMKSVTDDTCLKFLANKLPHKSLQEREKCVKILGGNIGLCLKILNNEKFEYIFIDCETVLKYIIEYNEYGLMEMFAKYQNDRDGLSFFLDIFKIFFCKVLLLIFCSKNLSEIFNQDTHICIDNLKDKLWILDVIDKAKEYINFNVNLNIILIWLSSNLVVC